jgi:hypothetical protein
VNRNKILHALGMELHSCSFIPFVNILYNLLA